MSDNDSREPQTGLGCLVSWADLEMIGMDYTLYLSESRGNGFELILRIVLLHAFSRVDSDAFERCW